MTNSCVELSVGDAGRRHVRLRLETGKSLSHAVLATLPNGSSEPVAIVPAGTQLKRALRFEEGGLLSTDVAERALEANLAEPLQEDGAIFVAEHPLARRGDPFLLQKQVPVSYIGTDVYYWTPEENEIREVIRASASWSVNYFVINASGGLHEDVSRKELAALATRTKIVAISAYDDESFVLWRLNA